MCITADWRVPILLLLALLLLAIDLADDRVASASVHNFFPKSIRRSMKFETRLGAEARGESRAKLATAPATTVVIILYTPRGVGRYRSRRSVAGENWRNIMLRDLGTGDRDIWLYSIRYVIRFAGICYILIRVYYYHVHVRRSQCSTR